jgi:hypothetical protein
VKAISSGEDLSWRSPYSQERGEGQLVPVARPARRRRRLQAQFDANKDRSLQANRTSIAHSSRRIRNVCRDRRPIARSARRRAPVGTARRELHVVDSQPQVPTGKGAAMATELTDGRAAVLAFTRELRRAVSAREEMMQESLHAYDQAVGDRLDCATTFFRAVQRADSAYESSLQVALGSFRSRSDESNRD